jgi:mono/diheme cytochrome c family protein
MNKHRIGALIAPFFILSCMATETNSTSVEKPSVVEVKVEKVESKKSHAELVEQGKRLYVSYCISCHNKDPNLKGALGPEMVDAPLEVMTSKVMTGVYPEKLPAGYTPKRSSRIMKAIPKLKDDIPAIYAWVQSMKPKKVEQSK